jgi:MFS family permease
MSNKQINKLKKINRVVIFLALSDVFTWGSYTIISLLTGIYLSNKLGGSALELIGIGTAIYFLTRAFFQIPIGLITDRIKKDKDEIAILFVGVILMGLPFLFYPQITHNYQFFLLQFIFGLGASLNVTNWRKLFALNVDSGREGIQYAIYETILSLSVAAISVLGGYIANINETYFDAVMSFGGIFIMLGSIWIILIYKYDSRNSK